MKGSGKIKPMKLQTLKNINNISPSGKKELRKEAIKWRHYIREHIKAYHYRGTSIFSRDYHVGEISWIEHFFNLNTKKHEKKTINP